MDTKEEVVHYKPSQAAVDLVAHTNLAFLVGITGAGKDTVKQQLLKNPDYHHIISHTTRAMRRNQGIMEEQGVQYHFIDFATAEHMVKNHDYIEVNYYSGNLYGTSIAEIQQVHDDDKIGITDMEVQGVEDYVQMAPTTIKAIFILPPSYEVWQERLEKRYSDKNAGAHDNIDKRITTAKDELAFALARDYFYFVINDDINKCVALVDQIARGGEYPQQLRDRAVGVAQQLLQRVTADLAEAS